MSQAASSTLEDSEPTSELHPTTTQRTPGAARTPVAHLPANVVERQQMAVVGRVAAGLVHDLNNLLAIVLGNAELARDGVPPDSASAENLRTIETTVRRAGSLCRTLLACARAEETTVVPVDTNAVVREIVALLQASSLARHHVRLDLRDDLPPLPAQPAPFRQLLLHLLIRAADECGPRGGRIRVSTSTADLDARAARQLHPAGLASGRYLRLRVADNGAGMDEMLLQKLFAPRDAHDWEDRVLDLASALAIVRAHRGGVRVFTEPSRGTLVDVFLPLEVEPERKPSPGVGRTRRSSADSRLSGTIVLADDEDVLRESLATYLGRLGATVETVADGDAALAAVRSRPRTDLVLLDLTMPGRGGLEVLAELRQAGHSMPVILMTGNADPRLASELARYAPAEVIAKPFSLSELLGLIRNRLPAQT